jgi:hypothetical protein
MKLYVNVSQNESTRMRSIKAACQFPEDSPGHRICPWLLCKWHNFDNPTRGFLNQSGQEAKDRGVSGPDPFFINLLFLQSRIHFCKSVVTQRWVHISSSEGNSTPASQNLYVTNCTEQRQPYVSIGWARKFPHLHPPSSLPYSQEPATGSHLEPTESGVHFETFRNTS